MNPYQLILGFYYSYFPHLSPEELEDLYQKKYKKVLTLVYNSSHIKLVLYYSGPLLNWLAKQHPEYIAVLNELINQKRVEVLGAPYYEPVLPLLSISDSLGQIEKMTTLLRKTLKKRSRGIWIPGSLWDQKLVSNLCNSGYGYTFLEESYWTGQGWKNSHGIFQTEDQGKTLSLYPINRALSEQILTMDCDKIPSYLQRNVPKSSLLCLFFSGERIGEKNNFQWLEKFVGCLQDHGDQILNVLPIEHQKNHLKDASTIFIKEAQLNQYQDFFKTQYSEDSGLAGLPTHSHFKTFLANHGPSRFLYGKSTYTSLLINQIRGDRSKKKIAREYLWKGQNIYGLWNNESSYLIARQSLASFMEAEKLTRERGIFKSSIMKMDIDNDGSEEFVYQGNTYNSAIDGNSGTLFQLDYLPDCWNYFFNEWGRPSFHDCFIKKQGERHQTALKAYNKSLKSPIDGYLSQRDEKQVILKTSCQVSDKNGRPKSMDIQKKYLFKRNWFVLSYKWTNTGDQRGDFSFITDMLLSFPAADNRSLTIKSQANKSTLEKKNKNSFYMESKALSLLDRVNNTDILVDFSEPVDVLVDYPAKDNWKKYNLLLIPHLEFSLYPQESKELTMSFKLSKHKP